MSSDLRLGVWSVRLPPPPPAEHALPPPPAERVPPILQFPCPAGPARLLDAYFNGDAEALKALMAPDIVQHAGEWFVRRAVGASAGRRRQR